MTLVIMAAGLGSRFGGTKQLEAVDSFGHTLIDYSVFDAARAGFDRVIFIIKRSIEADFKNTVFSRMKKRGIDVDYVFQELDSLPLGFKRPEKRKKPWGTAHAVCCLKGKINSPFAIINADDYYGRSGFLEMRKFLDSGTDDAAMVGYRLKNTLSKNGPVSRGVCIVESGYLSKIAEISHIEEKNGMILSGKTGQLDPNFTVSMNFWGFTPKIIEECESGFLDFLKSADREKLLSGECYLPDIVSRLIREEKLKVRVIENGGQWCGMTYKEDKENITSVLNELTKSGVYPKTF